MIQYLTYWLWLAAAVAAYWLLPLRWRMAFLGLACLAFLTLYVPGTVALMVPVCAVVYLVSNGPVLARLRGGRFAVYGPVAFLLFLLFYFKYLPAIWEGFSLPASRSMTGFVSASDFLIPLGISYFTFKLIHYAIERGRGNLPAHGVADYLSYVFLVPIFTAGPIERFDHFIQNRATHWSNDFAAEGLTRVAHGLIKKFVFGAVILAAMMKLSYEGGAPGLLEHLGSTHPFQVVAFLVLAYLYIYMDFSGYSDIAIGTSRLFGLRIMENFNFPFLAPNIGNVWKRWHMTLANWCQSYIYMPMLGLSRNPYLAVLTSFGAMGLWHAASLNWLAWGLYNGFGVMVYQGFAVVVRKRKWTFVKSTAWRWARYPMTFLYFAGSFAFTMTDGNGGIWGAFRLLARCFFINLPT